jgi:hypothetical protein
MPVLRWPDFSPGMRSVRCARVMIPKTTGRARPRRAALAPRRHVPGKTARNNP